VSWKREREKKGNKKAKTKSERETKRLSEESGKESKLIKSKRIVG